MKYAIIGGTGVYSLGDEVKEITMDTPYGKIDFTVMEKDGKEIVFLPRHGKGHGRPPHLINYLGNMWALKEYGVEFIFSTVAVGSTRNDIIPGDLVLIRDFLDFTKSRPMTFYDGSDGVVHVSMAEPYCGMLCKKIIKYNNDDIENIKDNIVYVCTEGPRFETAAEIRFYSQIGGDVVGMTNVPEVVLAKELSMCYCAVGIVTNMCTGLVSVEASGLEIVSIVDDKKNYLTNMFVDIILNGELRTDICSCRSSLIKV
ncbi:MAG: MTAP family purine nucleoside phosphorylase [Firmicutes bacterium]|nr:MTAP family purine nucleoside phosphorylase [Bacillota bacterium]